MSASFPDPDLDYRQHPACYRIGRGERGVFKVEPYKSELLPLWSIRTRESAERAAEDLWAQYERYKATGEFVGMDMARKYFQMGYTRAMRYARYPGGRKRASDGTPLAPQEWADADKHAIAQIYARYLAAVRADPAYQQAKSAHQPRGGS